MIVNITPISLTSFIIFFSKEMRKKDKFADEKVCCFYEIDENFDDLNLSKLTR